LSRRPLNIAIVCYPTIGGSGIVATELGQALAERGHNIHFVCHNLPARLKKLSPPIHFHPVDVVTYPLFQFPPYTLALATRLAQVVEKAHIDLVHVHYAIPHSISAQLAKDMTGIKDLKIVTTLHGTDVQLVGLDPSYRDITKFSMEGCCGVTAVSRNLERMTVREFGLSRDIEVIPNFIDPAQFRKTRQTRLRGKLAPGGEKVVIHISNFRPAKKVLDIVKVFNRLRKKVDSVLVMIGDGPDKPAAQALAARYGLTGRVHFIPPVHGVERYLSTADLFLLTSVLESFGLAALEAMACEVPVLAYRVGGLPEVVRKGQGGYLVKTGDWIGMAREAVRILKDDELAVELGRRGRRRAVEQFSAARVVKIYEDYYYRMLKGDGPE
jgi:N-acetyl-alpha-D-glucosaminyl L-malate synthase BshA